jgi:hypothetical protein
MLYGKYKFHLILESEAILPPFKGSTFRGIFGMALKKVICALKRQECADCLLRDRCIYTTMFEIPSGPGLEGQPSPPHPFILEPTLSMKTHFQPGDDFEFSLILMGRYNDHLPYFVYAIDQMGRIGIGKRISGKRAQFLLKQISVGSRIIYDSSEKKLIKADLESLSLDGLIKEGDNRPISRISMELRTPLRLKSENRFQADLPFHTLVRAALRRVALVNNHFGDGEPVLDYGGLVGRAEKVETENSTLRWFDWKRYSNRQEQSMLMGGLVGEVTYRGDLSEFVPLLRYCEKVHLGKATTFGLGQIKVFL